MKYTIQVFILSLLLIFQTLNSQVVTATFCHQAVNICSNASFNIDPNGNGVVPASGTFGNPSTVAPPLGAPGGFGCLLANALNSTWMVINIQTTGILEFSFGAGTVNPQAGCYDWAMWPFGGGITCAQITGGSVAPVKCNWNSLCSGGTGIANTIPLGASPANFPSGLSVTCGQQFIICFSNFSSVNTAVNLNFFGSAQVSCNPIPNPLTLGNQTICQGNSANLNVTGSAGNTYTWQPGNINTGTGTSITVSPTVTTTYTVSGSGGCGSQTGSTTAVVTVNAVNAAYTIANANPAGPGNGTSGTQCLTGNSFNFTSSSAAGVHSWNFGAGATPLTSSAVNPTGVTYSAPGTYTISHTVTNGPCVSTITHTVKVNPMPTATATGTNPTCSQNNGAIQINNTSPLVPAQSVTNFSLNGVSTGGSQFASGLGAGTYNISMVNNFGCPFTFPFTLTNTPGITNVNLTPTNATCVGANGSILASGVVGGTPTYSYNINGGAYSTAATFNSLAPGTYTIGVRDVNNCIFTKTVTVGGVTGPTNLTFTTSATSCIANTGVLGVTGVTGGTPAYTFSLNGVTSASVVNSLA
ncbi:MAG: hypothetical protein ACK5QC_02480, partial [Bacteroidota bacterium]